MTPIWLKRLRYRLRKGGWPEPERIATWAAGARFARALSRLGPGDVVIDAGANVGDFTARMAATGAAVHAFEPDPWSMERLRRRFAGRPNVILHEAAVGDADGTVTLFRAEGFDADPEALSESSSVFGDKSGADAASAVAVAQIDLARFVEGLGRVAVLKLDVEGAEVPVLEALIERGAIARVGEVFAETHDAKIPSLAARTAALRRRIAECGWPVNLDWR